MKISGRGSIGTIIYHGLILALLLFAGLTYPDPPPEEQGILVNFGTDLTGMGKEEPKGDEEEAGNPEQPVEQVSPPVSKPEPVVKQQTKASEPDVTQDVEKTKVTETKKPTAEEIERQKQAERDRIAAAEAERKRLEEEARKQQEADRISNMGKNAFGNKGTGTGTSSQGVNGGTGNQGSINGSNNSDNYGTGGGLGNGISYGLGGRKAVGDLPKPEGCIVTSKIEITVEIQVNQQGVVESASVLTANYADNCIWNSVVEAAKKTKFNSDPNASYKQKGWIKYIIEPR